VSSTAKSRGGGAGLHAPCASGHLSSNSEQRLLVHLHRLCKQPLEASYRRKLEALALLLQGCTRAEIEHRAKASLRSVQRWAARVRRSGPEALRGRPRPTAKLNDEQQARLAAALKGSPPGLGQAQSRWSAALLMRYVVESYGVRFSLRHCRRLLAGQGVTKTPGVTVSARKGPPRQAGVEGRPSFLQQPLSDSQRKCRALARIKRLASAGMPLRPFAYTLFDLVQDAVPYDEASPGLATGSPLNRTALSAILITIAGFH
jgi:transposase